MRTLNPRWILIIVAIAVIVLALAADRVNTIWQTRHAVKEAVAPHQAADKATTGMTQDAAQADTNRASTGAAIGAARQGFHDDIERSERNDPSIADRGNRPVPERVRDAFAARRAARERSGHAADER